MELFKIINARKTLEEFSDKADIGACLSYRMAKFIAKTENEQAFYIAEMRKLFSKYAIKKDDEEGAFVVSDGKTTEFNAAVEALNKTDVEDPGIRFDLSVLSSELKLSIKQIYPLLDFIDEDK